MKNIKVLPEETFYVKAPTKKGAREFLDYLQGFGFRMRWQADGQSRLAAYWHESKHNTVYQVERDRKQVTVRNHYTLRSINSATTKVYNTTEEFISKHQNTEGYEIY
jgi:hypothetical protein